jgi:hypothetical protein
MSYYDKYFKYKNKAIFIYKKNNIMNGGVGDAAAAAPETDSDGDDDYIHVNKCSICNLNPSNIIFNPCCHKVICDECFKKLIELDTKCPICRKDILFSHKIDITVPNEWEEYVTHGYKYKHFDNECLNRQYDWKPVEQRVFRIINNPTQQELEEYENNLNDLYTGISANTIVNMMERYKIDRRAELIHQLDVLYNKIISSSFHIERNKSEYRNLYGNYLHLFNDKEDVLYYELKSRIREYDNEREKYRKYRREKKHKRNYQNDPTDDDE